LVAGILVALLLVGVASGYLLTRTSGPILTLQQARQAFYATWPRFDSGFNHSNPFAVANYATPDLTRAVTGALLCGCGPWPVSKWSVDLSVPPQTNYPLSFLAQISISKPVTNRFTEIVVFTKATPEDRWKVAYFVGSASTHRYLDSSTSAAPRPMTFNSSMVAGQLANFFQSEMNTGAAPPNDYIPLSGSVGQEINRDIDTRQSLAQQGLTQHAFTFTPANTSINFGYPGGEIACGDYWLSVAVTPPPGQTTAQSADRSEWGPTLPPGTYSSVTYHGIHNYCVSITPNPSPENPHRVMVWPIAFLGGVYLITGQSAQFS
jgi:hypothetical protein